MACVKSVERKRRKMINIVQAALRICIDVKAIWQIFNFNLLILRQRLV